MKKLFTTLALVAILSYGSFAQHCATDSTLITPVVGTTPGLSPSDSVLPCSTRGTQISDTIYFKNFTSFSGQTVNYLKIDSIYLPAGLCWETNKGNNKFVGGEDGVILIQGITFALAGQYKLRIIVDANAGPGGSINLTNQDAEQLANLRYRVRIVCPGNPCPALNTTDTTDAYIAYPNPNCQYWWGISDILTDISDPSVVPNPFSTKVTMSFSSETQGVYTVKMTTLLGAVVSTKDVNIVNGQNEVQIDRNGLSTGLYLLSISNGKSSVTKKVIVE